MRVWAVLFTLVVGCAEVPGVVRDEIVTTTRIAPGAKTIVFFTDFQCPFCRQTHLALAPLVDQAARDRAATGRGGVRVVYKHVPLPRHPDARSAARAAICVEMIAEAIRDDYVNALFEASDLSESGCEALAVERGVDRTRFQRCLAGTAVDARLERDLSSFDAVKGDGVPLIFVGQSRLEGAQSKGSLEAAIQDARP